MWLPCSYLLQFCVARTSLHVQATYLGTYLCSVIAVHHPSCAMTAWEVTAQPEWQHSQSLCFWGNEGQSQEFSLPRFTWPQNPKSLLWPSLLVGKEVHQLAPAATPLQQLQSEMSLITKLENLDNLLQDILYTLNCCLIMGRFIMPCSIIHLKR